MEELIAVLEPFEEATKAMSGSNYPMISMLSPLLYRLLDITLKPEDNDSSSSKHIKAAIAEDLKNRYSTYDVRHTLNVAAFLDPRFKDLDPFILEEDRDDIKEDVKMELLQLAESIETESQDQNVDKPVEPPSPKRKKSGPVSALFAGMAQSSRRQLSGPQTVKSELRRYQEEDPIDLDANPLEWWKARLVQFPLLAKLVRKVWSLPATSVRSEEVFSAAGNVLTKKRARLLPENVNSLVFLHENMP